MGWRSRIGPHRPRCAGRQPATSSAVTPRRARATCRATRSSTSTRQMPSSSSCVSTRTCFLATRSTFSRSSRCRGCDGRAALSCAKRVGTSLRSPTVAAERTPLVPPSLPQRCRRPGIAYNERRQARNLRASRSVATADATGRYATKLLQRNDRRDRRAGDEYDAEHPLPDEAPEPTDDD